MTTARGAASWPTRQGLHHWPPPLLLLLLLLLLQLGQWRAGEAPAAGWTRFEGFCEVVTVAAALSVVASSFFLWGVVDKHG